MNFVLAELATRHDAAVRVTFESKWTLLEKDLGESKSVQRNQDAKKLVSLLSFFSESAIIPKNRLRDADFHNRNHVHHYTPIFPLCTVTLVL
jgi:hypothetical protein